MPRHDHTIVNFISNLTVSLADEHDLTDCFLHIYDAFTPEYIADVVTRSGRPRVILSDHMTLSRTVPSHIQGLFLPLFAQREANLWTLSDFDDGLPETEHTFCIMSNKKTLNRSLCLRMVEIMAFQNFAYTWSGLGRSTDMSAVIAELDSLGADAPLCQDQRGALLAPIEMPANIIGDTQLVEGVNLLYNGNRGAWEEGLDRMFSRSAISLITETYVPTKEAIFTEKTMYSVLGLTFPIWVGGFGQAEIWKKIGFDTFDDVIDHGYQHMSTLVERCWSALYLNRAILENFDLARALRTQHHDRLLRNRDMLLSGRLLDYSLEQIDLMPVEYQQHARECIRLVCQV